MYSLSNAPFSSNSSWNTAIPQGSTYAKVNWPGSTGYNYSVAWDAYSPAVYVASASDPLVQVSVPGGWGYPAGTVGVHMPAAANGASGTDGELVVVDGDNAYNFWQFSRTSSTTAKASSYGVENVVTGDGWGSKSPFLSAGTTAVGASELGGLLVKAQTDSGTIDHALQLVVDSTLVKAGFTGSAIAGDGGSASGIVKEGDHLGIPAGTPMPSGLSSLGQEVFRAMQQYGAYVVDVAGGVTNVRAQANSYDASTITALWHDMGHITPLLQEVTPNTSGTSSGSTSTPPPTSGSTSGSTSTPPPTSGSTSGSTSTPPPTTGSTSGSTSTLPPTSGSTSGSTSTTGSTSGSTSTPPPATQPTTLSWVAANGTGISSGNGDLNAGTVRLDLNFSGPVKVSGTPTLALNDGGTANYVSGSGTNNLVFNYAIASGQNTSDLAIKTFNLSGVKDQAGNSVNLTGAPTMPAGTLKIDTTAPTLASIATSGQGITGGTGHLNSGTVHLTVGASEAVNVSGTPSLTLNDGGTAKYVSGSGTDKLVFDYTVGKGQKTSDLAVSSFNLSGVEDQAGNNVSLTGAPTNPAGTLAIGSASSAAGHWHHDSGSTAVDTTASTGASHNDAPHAGSTGTGPLGAPSQPAWFTPGAGGKLSDALSGLGEALMGCHASNGGNAGGASAASDGGIGAKLALLSQYLASSFASSADLSGASLMHAAPSSTQTPTLTRPGSA